MQNSTRDCFQALPASEVAVLFDWNLSRDSIKICCFAQDSLWNMLIFSYFLLSNKDQGMIERSSKALSTALIGFISHEKKISCYDPKIIK